MRFKILICLILVISLSFISFTGFAQEREWWFDIEIIAYKRNIAPDDISEQFSSSLNEIDPQNSINILSEYVHPDLTFIRANLPVCFAEPVESDFPNFTYQYDELLYSTIEYETLIVELPLFDESGDQLSEEDSQDNAQQQGAAPPPTSLFSGPLVVPEWLPPRILKDHACAYEPQENRQPFVDEVPKTIDGVEWDGYRKPYLLSQSSLELKDLAKDIGRKRGLTTLLHMGWRQQVFFGQEESPPLHLIAGKNYGDAFTLDGTPPIKRESVIVKPSSVSKDINEFDDSFEPTDFVQSEGVDLVSRIQKALASNESSVDFEQLIYLLQQPPVIHSEALYESNAMEQQERLETNIALPSIWELDGKLTIFLRYIGRTPYLHIDGKMDFRAPVIEASTLAQAQSGERSQDVKQRLQSFEFAQMRRVISNQLHYFDHPLFGLLVQIRRYDLPPPVEEMEPIE